MSSSSSELGTEEQMYEVDAIVDKKVRKGKVKYFVKWTGYDSSQNTWEPKEHLPIDMVEEFEETYKNNNKKERFCIIIFNQ